MVVSLRAIKTLLPRFWLGILFMAVALAVFMTKGFGAQDRSQPVSMSLRRDGGWTESAQFPATIPGSYRASVTLTRRYPPREMECLADVGPFTAGPQVSHPDCPPDYAPLQLRWMVLEDGQRSASSGNFGAHAGEHADAAIGRSLGSVKLRSGHSYKMLVRVVDAPDALWVTTPRASLAYIDTAALAISGLTFSLLAGALGATGLSLSVAALLRVGRSAPAAT